MYPYASLNRSQKEQIYLMVIKLKSIIKIKKLFSSVDHSSNQFLHFVLQTIQPFKMKVIQQGGISTDSFTSGYFQLHTATNIMQLNMNNNSKFAKKSIDLNNPSTIISHTLSHTYCQNTAVVNVNQLRYKIEESKYNTNEDCSFRQYINKLKSSVYCNQSSEVLTFKHTYKLDPVAGFHCNASAKCSLYYPVHFSALRKGLYGTECNFEKQYIESLSKSTSCHVTGGKKGTFKLTADDKYLLKSIKQDEFKNFLDNFPSYFNYITDIFQHKLPSLLVPIIGCYVINDSEYILVMPNLFCSNDYCSSKLKKFDLKGTLNPKRYIKDKREDNVRLDKNFIEYTKGSPLTLNEQSIKYLIDAIENDTTFLCKSNIMDYSLLIGINEENNKIIGGIIDYIETFSAIKKVERIFKSRFMKDPTIQEPSIYKKRFQYSVTNKYFICVKV
eukprot:106280_1